jgi:thioredoxin-like negative regulator of GroEL
VTLDAGIEEHLRAEADALIASTGMEQVELQIDVPNMSAQWMMGNLATLLADLGDRWPGCASEMTPEVLGQLGEIEALLDDMSAARSRLEALQATEPQHAATRRLEALIAFRDVVTVHPDPHALQERLVRNAGDLEARHALAVHHLMAGRHQQAIDDLLAVLRQNAAHDDGRARASLLRAFDLIGSDDPLVGAARRELAKLLF